MNWISVKDALPQLGTPVLAYRTDGVVRVTHFYKTGVLTPKTKAHRFFQNEEMIVTHWMPLPAPPTKSQQL
jgi:hypothetical protein